MKLKSRLEKIMRTLITKLQDNNLMIEAICFVLIALAMVVLLYRVVWPNFGNKSIALGFMTAVGALIVLSYAIFVEWKEEIEHFQINSYITLHKEKPISASIPSNSHISTQITYLAYGPDEQLSFTHDGSDGSLITQELTLFNIAMLITGDFIDWRKNTIRIAEEYSQQYRPPNKKDKNEEVLYFEQIIKKINPHFITLKVNKDMGIKTLAIYPPKTTVTANRESLCLDNPFFCLHFNVVEPHRTYLVQEKPNMLHASKVAIEATCTLKPKIHGHKEEKEYRSLAKELVDHVTEKMHVKDYDMPKSIGWI